MEIRRHSAVALVAAASLAMAACGARTAPPPAVARATFEIVNQSRENICYVNLVLTSEASESWGPDQLEASEVIAPGGRRRWTLPSGYYNLRLQDCRHETMMERDDVGIPTEGLSVRFRVRE